jgi:hypothetical protein
LFMENKQKNCAYLRKLRCGMLCSNKAQKGAKQMNKKGANMAQIGPKGVIREQNGQHGSKWARRGPKGSGPMGPKSIWAKVLWG